MPLASLTIHQEDAAGRPTGKTWEVFIDYREEAFLYGADADGHRGERRRELTIDGMTSFPPRAPQEIFDQAERTLCKQLGYTT